MMVVIIIFIYPGSGARGDGLVHHNTRTQNTENNDDCRNLDNI